MDGPSFILVVLLTCPLVTFGRPVGGKYEFDMSIEGARTCYASGLLKGGKITLSVLAHAKVTLEIAVKESLCANIEFDDGNCPEVSLQTLKTTVEVLGTGSLAFVNDQALFTANKSGIYVVELAYHTQSLSKRGLTSAGDAGSRDQDAEQELSESIAGTTLVNKDQTIKVFVNFKNPYGFLSAVDYPYLIFYGIMTALYAIYGIVWLTLMACSFKDLVRLQFWIAAVIIIGLVEKVFFVSEYSTINEGNTSSGLIIVAETVSAAKRALARMLLIIVSLGFGTVRPRLGEDFKKVVAAGVIYFLLAVLDGILRTTKDTVDTRDFASLATFIVLFLFDVFIVWWIFKGLVDTRKVLRIRKNEVKLSLYNHLMYALIFTIVATIGFIVWMLLEIDFPANDCLSDWKEAWLKGAFWHILFVFILLVIMVLWRPSANSNRFAYSLVETEEPEGQDEEQGGNKNFESVKMRTLSKSEPSIPPVTSHAEDDLKWVEENLPSTAVDKSVLPLVLDSDEEVMTTQFEVSKLK
ncbi:hypothetical protein EMCRGX_G026854 [Ephydatia muelleri]